MKRRPHVATRVARLAPHRLASGPGPAAALACALFLGACGTVPMDGGDEPTGADAGALGGQAGQGAQGGQAGQGGAGSAIVDPTGKIEASLLTDPNQDQPRDVIAMLDETQIALPTYRPVGQIAVDFTDSARIEQIAARYDAAKNALLDRLAAQRISTMNRYRNLPAMHVRVDSAAALLALAADASVERVVANQSHDKLDTAPADLTLINQPTAAAAGKLGSGATVAVLDTGTDYRRAPFNCSAAGASGCPVVYAADFAPQDNNVDDNGHGTNVSGIVLSVAPAAHIVALDVFNGASAWTTDIMAAIDWVIQNKATYNIVAINMSLGGGTSTTTCPGDPLAVSVASARTAGVLSAIASGNSGTTNAISSPACSPDAVSVGAVHAANLGNLQWSNCGDATTKADQIACFSCSSSFLTMLAPGVMITAAGITMSGTSQATPHVAGAIAVLRAAFPSETPTAIVSRLTTYGAQVRDSRNGITKPRLDLWASLNGTASTTPAPTAGPAGTISLNAKAAYTKTTAVIATLATTSGKATQVCLSESSSCTKWVAAATSVGFTLSADNGSKTVNAWWKDASGNISASAASASIILDNIVPVDGTFTATTSDLQASFTWSGFSDAGSGIAGYRLMTNTTAVPAGCASGTVAYEGTATSLSKAFTAAGTVYARLCAKDAVGNMSAGSAATLVLKKLVPATHAVSLSGGGQTTQVGSTTGGTAYDDTCPSGQVLVGFNGSLSATGTAAVNRQITGHCGSIEITGTTVTVTATANLTTRGPAGVAAWTRNCPANQVVVGFAGRAGLLVDQLAFQCAALTATAATSGTALTVGAAIAQASVGGTGGTAFTAIKCPTGEVATVARVRTGDNLDAFGLACSKPTIGS